MRSVPERDPQFRLAREVSSGSDNFTAYYDLSGEPASREGRPALTASILPFETEAAALGRMTHPVVSVPPTRVDEFRNRRLLVWDSKGVVSNSHYQVGRYIVSVGAVTPSANRYWRDLLAAVVDELESTVVAN